MDETNNTSDPEVKVDKVLCKFCKQPLNNDAIVCFHCSRDLRPFYRQFIPSTTVFMVVIAILQAVIGGFQLNDSRLKRIEAEDVLKKARHVFMLASSNSNTMKIQTALVLKKAEDTADFTNAMASKASNEIKDTRRSFQDLAVSLTDPLITTFALQGEILYYVKPPEGAGSDQGNMS